MADNLPFPIIVQARMGSARLPGKMLLPFGSGTLLSCQLERLKEVSAPGMVIVATSSNSSDDELAAHVSELNCPLIRGPEDDVYSRFLMALSGLNCRAFYRYCADRPFFDPALLKTAARIFEEGSMDLVTNVFPATFPKGQTVELISTERFLESGPQITSTHDREHITSWFYKEEKNQGLRIKNFVSYAGNHSHVNMCIDSDEDYRRACALLKKLDGKSMPPFTDLLSYFEGGVS